MTRHPPIPVNVRLERPDGSVVPLELVYRGRDREGIHVWENVHEVDVPVGSEIHCDLLPGYTTVRINPS